MPILGGAGPILGGGGPILGPGQQQTSGSVLSSCSGRSVARGGSSYTKSVAVSTAGRAIDRGIVVSAKAVGAVADGRAIIHGTSTGAPVPPGGVLCDGIAIPVGVSSGAKSSDAVASGLVLLRSGVSASKRAATPSAGRLLPLGAVVVGGTVPEPTPGDVSAPRSGGVPWQQKRAPRFRALSPADLDAVALVMAIVTSGAMQ